MNSRTKNIGRLQQILTRIHDPNIKEIVKRVVEVEISYRSTERVNFPRQRIRDIIDGVARTIENNNKKVRPSEISKS
ncbi:MAG: hypothetical protein DYG83_00960 [Candidatus Brocadia sp. AMX2]|nr:MAG: hypothetical protein EDM70_01780 [Candidatus Brocadia sp. AMX2]MBC6930718.1 hypothetical protein [Candidatus Brocadia sp.]MCE7865393.1 hypothetical protein [Candidatus Brocadia sp. AMX2]RIJ93311.1 MAG: hypothetical protein DB853_01430 [Candidatus Brocadia sp.]